MNIFKKKKSIDDASTISPTYNPIYLNTNDNFIQAIGYVSEFPLSEEQLDKVIDFLIEREKYRLISPI